MFNEEKCATPDPTGPPLEDVEGGHEPGRRAVEEYRAWRVRTFGTPPALRGGATLTRRQVRRNDCRSYSAISERPDNVNVIVYVTIRAKRYHGGPDCRAFLRGQDVLGVGRHDIEPPWAIGPMSVEAAKSMGKWPCRTCIPKDLTAELTGSSTDDFGHKPVMGVVAEGELGPVCSRCTDCSAVSASGSGPVPWPCMSAIVFGLTSREDGR